MTDLQIVGFPLKPSTRNVKQEPSLVGDSVYYNFTYQKFPENADDDSDLQPKDYNQIFDEPTVALDQEIKERFLQYLLKIKEKIIIVVTHDDEVIACCNHIVEMPGIV